MFLRQKQERILQRAETCNDLVNFFPHIEAKIERNLIVAAASSVQFGAGRSDPFSQRRLDVHVHVFQRLVPDELVRSDLVFDLAQTARDHLKFIGGENPGAGKSGSVRNGSSNIVVIETAIEGNRLAVALRDFRCGRGKSSFSHDYVASRSRTAVTET